MYDTYECPCCGGKLTIKKYKEDGRVVETNVSCDCGYAWNEAYGRTEEHFPEGYDEEGNKIES